MAKQIVPPFSKGDVKQIVNEGIQNGEIKATKLYLHTLTVEAMEDGGDEPIETTCRIISTSNESFKNKSHQVQKLGYVAGQFDYSGRGNFFPILAITYESEPGIICLSSNGIYITRYDVSNFLSDTITEL